MIFEVKKVFKGGSEGQVAQVSGAGRSDPYAARHYDPENEKKAGTAGTRHLLHFCACDRLGRDVDPRAIATHASKTRELTRGEVERRLTDYEAAGGQRVCAPEEEPVIEHEFEAAARGAPAASLARKRPAAAVDDDDDGAGYEGGPRAAPACRSGRYYQVAR